MRIDTVQLVVIGNEILSGKVADANTPFLAQALRERGVLLTRIEVVPDALEPIVRAVRRARDEADVVFTSGGVGPTHDDITMAAVAQALGKPRVRHAGFADTIARHYGARTNAALLSMADLPEGAQLIEGGDLWVPVVLVDRVYVLPGIPELFRRKFFAMAHLLHGKPIGLAKLYLDCDEGEIAALLASAERTHAGVQIGSYPRIDAGAPHRVMVTIESTDAAVVAAVRAEVVAGLPPGALVGSEP